MKKFILPTTIAVLLLADQSYAKSNDGPFIEANLNLSQVYNKAVATQGNYSPQGKVNSDINGGVGIAAGYKHSFENKIFITPEVFYDYFDNFSRNYYRTATNKTQDTLEIRSRFGLKANLGYQFSEKFAGYASYGYATVTQMSKYPSVNRSDKDHISSEIYGLGTQYKLTDNFSLRGEFNTQKVRTPFGVVTGVISKIRIDTFKLGLAYNF